MPVGHASRLSYGVALLAAVWVGGYWLWWPSGAGAVDPEVRIRVASSPRDERGGEPPEIEVPQGVVAERGAGGPDAAERGEDAAAPDAGDDAPGGVPGDDAGFELPVGTTHTVVRDDTLEGLSKRYYGTIRHAGLIFEANRDQLSSMDRLTLGQVLRIPPRPEG